MAPDAVKATFSFNGATHTAPDASQTLSAYLRQHTRVTSVKTGCGEGGCGACAVLVRRPGEADVSTLNACLTPCGALHGAAVLASDGLKPGARAFHAVHDALATLHATQCGFCTPGVAIACAAAAAKRAKEGPGAGDAVARGLDGNLCRCTGYRPIIDAARSLTAADVEDLAARCAPPAAGAAAAADGALACGGGVAWAAPATLAAARAALAASPLPVLVAGNTGSGVYKGTWPPAPGSTVVSLAAVTELKEVAPTAAGGLTLGGAVTLASLVDACAAKSGDGERWGALAAHGGRIAGAHVRAAATLGGNLSLAAGAGLESDVVTMLAAAGATVTVDGKEEGVLAVAAGGPLAATSLVERMSIPPAPPGERFWTTRVAPRYSHAVATFQAGVSVVARGETLTAPVVVLAFKRADGRWAAARAASVEAALDGASATDLSALAAALAAARSAGASAADAGLISGFCEGALASALAPLFAGASAGAGPKARAVLTAASLPPPAVAKGERTWGPPLPGAAPVGDPVAKDRACLQASGEAVYTSDVPLPPGGLHAAPVLSTVAAGTLKRVDPAPALVLPGVVSFISVADVPGSNDIIGDTIFADGSVCHVGERIGLILAETDAAARAGAAAVVVEYGPPPEPPILTIAEAVARDSFYDLEAEIGPATKAYGADVDAALAAAPCVLRGVKVSMPSQLHMYLETQAAVAAMDEDGIKIVSGTQCVDMVQAAVVTALGLPAHAVCVSTRRLGGGFGGKSARSQPTAAAAAVAAFTTGRPVRLVLTRAEDMATIGGRCELEAEYDVGFDAGGRVVALAVRAVLLGGARKEISNFIPLLMANTIDQNYAFGTALRVTTRLARTNLPPRTIMRAPGTLQAVVVAEHVIASVAAALGLDPTAVRETNLLSHAALPDVRRPCAGVLAEGVTAGGAAGVADPGLFAADGTSDVVVATALGGEIPIDQMTVPRMWRELAERADIDARAKSIAEFNAANPFTKRGLSMASARFVMQVDAKPAAVHIHHDGSVLVTSPGHEMGQGLHTKLLQSCCASLSTAFPPGSPHLPLSLFRVADTSTDALPNSGPSWGSTTSEASCEAVKMAAGQLAGALKEKVAAALADGKTGVAAWTSAVRLAHPAVGFSASTMPLSAIAFYDGSQRAGAKGKALTYNGCGVAVTEVTLDALTGEVRVDRADLLLDAGHSLNPALDVGQAEGGYVQGLGLMLSEDVAVDPRTGASPVSTWDYKIPTADVAPRDFRVHLLAGAPHARGVLSSKAVGEPPLLLAVTALHAVQAAIDAARETLGGDAEPAEANGAATGPCRAPRATLAPPATPAAVRAAIGRLPLAEWAASKD